MMNFSDAQILAFVGGYFFPFCRIGAFFFATPIIGTRIIPTRVRLALALAVTVLVAPILPPFEVVPSLSLQTGVIVIQQMLIGLAMGFTLQIVFQVFVLAGQLIAMKMGLGFASMNDPANGVTVTVLSQFFLILSTLLFLSLNGHLIMMDIMAQSFTVLPVGQSGLPSESIWQMVNLGGWMFKCALLIALPILTSILVVNIAFGVMSRSAPQMNVFAVGFPITLVFGMVLVWFGLVNFLPNYERFVNEGFVSLKSILGLEP